MAFEGEDFDELDDPQGDAEAEREAILALWRGDDKQDDDPEPDPSHAPQPHGDDRIDRLAGAMEQFVASQSRPQPAYQPPPEPEMPDFSDFDYRGEALNRFDEDQREALRELSNELGRAAARAAYQRSYETIGQTSQATLQRAVVEAQQRMEAAQWLQQNAPDVASAPEQVRYAVATGLAKNPAFHQAQTPVERLQLFVAETRNLMRQMGGGAASGGTRKTTAAPRGGARAGGSPKGPKPGTQAAHMVDMMQHEKSRRRA